MGEGEREGTNGEGTSCPRRPKQWDTSSTKTMGEVREKYVYDITVAFHGAQTHEEAGGPNASTICDVSGEGGV